MSQLSDICGRLAEHADEKAKTAPTAAEIASEEKTHRQQQIDGKLAKIIPSRYLSQGRKWESEITQQCKRGMSGDGFFLTGTTGTRKSSLAADILRSYAHKNNTTEVIWFTAADFACRIKSSVSYSSKETAYEIVKGYGEAKCIVLEELGREYDSAWDKHELHRLIWQAYDKCQFLIVTTNVQDDSDEGNVLNVFDGENQALASRLSTLTHIDMGDKDYRQTAAENKG